ESFLQGRSSNDVKALRPGQGQHSSLLDRKGYLIAFVTVYRLNDSFLILSEKSQSQEILKQFATYHFREQISYTEVSDKFVVLALQGPSSEAFIASMKDLSVPQEEYSTIEAELFGAHTIVIRRSLCGDCGFVLLADAEKSATFLPQIESAAASQGIKPISESALNVLRIEAGQAKFGVDISPEHMLPETGLEQYAASYNKGCFQGQEVLARIKTYGAPRRALVGLIFEEAPAEPIELNTQFSIAGEENGCIKSGAFSPSLDHYIALAYIGRDYRVPDRKVSIEINGKSYPVVVKFLPFYSAGTSKARAQMLYDAALLEFARGSEQNAIVKLREVIELDPLHSDAYESLGVILSRHEQYDEAIALMHRLQSLDPESIMAHTNLSIYYMHLGDKDRAEEEKALAMSIRMAQFAREHAQKKKDEIDKQKNAEEAEKRLAMFRQVLAIDPNDFLANNGVGTVYVELEKYEDAIPFLIKTIESKPTHTVAYLALGKAYENLGRIDDSIAVYRSGI
ncbi:MAG: tetratricopeptide repeat protein, partial [Candidatus Obscuribacterales bacterium]|nr:tetratricopeptide repeat protein [Candidatus Obscuribacterales bacterium]